MIQNNKKYPDFFVVLFFLLVFVFSLIALFDYYYNIRPKTWTDHLITCPQCKGSGEYPSDVNKTIFDAKMTLYLNHHLNVNKCKDCIKVENDDSYVYCEEVNKTYQLFVQEYAAAGKDIRMSVCHECLGSGQFSVMKKDRTYYTQEQYDREFEKRKLKNNRRN